MAYRSMRKPGGSLICDRIFLMAAALAGSCATVGSSIGVPVLWKPDSFSRLPGGGACAGCAQAPDGNTCEVNIKASADTAPDRAAFMLSSQDFVGDIRARPELTPRW